MENPNLNAPQEHSHWMAKFAPLWIGQAISLIGSSLVQFALVWWLTEKTGSTRVLAAATLAALIPQVVLGPFAGALVDRWKRRLVLIAADGSIAIATLGLILLFANGAIQPWHVYILLFVRSLGSAFHWPAMQASTTLMVPEKHLSRLAGANQTLNGLVNIAAPPLGALLLSVLPVQSVLAIDILTAAIAIGILAFITIPEPIKRSGSVSVTPKTVWQDVGQGLRYVVAWPGLLGILIMATLINLALNPAFSFIPLVVTRVFNGNVLQYGWMDSVTGIGAVLGGLVLTAWGGFKRKILTTQLGLVGLGLGVLAIGFAPPWGYFIALSGMFIVGIMGPLVNGPLFAIVQTKVEPQMQGRVFTLIQSAASAMTPIGLALATPLTEWLGLQAWFVFGGVICITMGLVSLVIKDIATIDDQQPGTAVASTPVPAPGD